MRRAKLEGRQIGRSRLDVNRETTSKPRCAANWKASLFSSSQLSANMVRWAGISVSEKLPKNGDFILAYRDPSGAPAQPKMLVDNKDKTVVAESDLDKLVRDAM